MCELFGINSNHDVEPNAWLREFFTHSDKNPHGWGMAMFYGRGAVALEKEPVMASRSQYLKERLRQGIYVSTMLAHVREATIGTIDYSNTHPFVNRDQTGRCWTLAHNGTIFESAALRPYVFQQEGETDSERILCYIIDQVNWKTSTLGRALTAKERCELIDEIIKVLAPGNKINMLLFDGEILYAHTNLRGTLSWCEIEGTRIFATVPFHTGTTVDWERMPFMTLCAYHEGEQIYQGEPHAFEYTEDPEKMRYLHMAFAGL
ncbi:MAG: class II glutamine amidotransferase [Eubacterium sp.]|nr:class II glutamine amidotransferase [Eubacterium sp.]